MQSQASGLRPLFDCVHECKEKNTTSGCMLYDREIGLAAARLICEAGCISSVVTQVASHGGSELLTQHSISIDAQKTVDMILNKEKNGPCMMELKAREVPMDMSFFDALKEVFKK